MRLFTLTRSGVIPRPRTSAHYCGTPHTRANRYTLTLTVSGMLTPPEFFLIENSMVDAWIVDHFATRESRSCELMSSEICDVVIAHLADFPQWTLESLDAETIGSNMARITCSYRKDGESRELVSSAFSTLRGSSDPLGPAQSWRGTTPDPAREAQHTKIVHGVERATSHASDSDTDRWLDDGGASGPGYL